MPLAGTTASLTFDSILMDNGRWSKHELELWFGEGLRGLVAAPEPVHTPMYKRTYIDRNRREVYEVWSHS